MNEPLDLVTLSWCLGEIREALNQTEAHLEKGLESADNESSVRLARAVLHQAHGALLVVDVPGVAVLTEEAEALLDAVERGDVAMSGDLVSRLQGAFRACIEYLEELLDGGASQPLHLFPYLRRLLEARGAERIHPADMFFPDLTRRLAARATTAPAPDARQLVAARAAFEKGLLALLREPADTRIAADMHQAVATVEQSDRGAPNRHFWRVVLAFFDGLRDGSLTVDVYAKRLLARLNLQIRKTINEGAPIADRLFKDTLFSLACSREGSAELREVRRVYQLDGAVPADFDTPRFGRHDRRVIRATREALSQARSAWDKVGKGGREELAAAGRAFAGFAEATDALPNPGMRALAAELVNAWRVASAKPDGMPDALSLDIATAVLFAEQVLDQGARASDELDPRAHELAQRLRLSLQGAASVSDGIPPWLQELSRRAQERLTMSVFISEMLANFRGVEKELDAFFRDPAQRAHLPATLGSMQQVIGALTLLGQQDAADGARAARARIAEFVESPEAPEVAACERLASSMGALGFFVESLQQAGRTPANFSFDRDTGDFHAKLTEPRRAAVVYEEPAGDAVVTASSLEATLGEHSRHAEGLFHDLRAAPTDPAVRGQLREALEQVRDDAELLDDGDLKRQAVEAIGLLSEEAVADGRAAAAPTTPAEMTESSVDAELLGIFLDEAAEVLDAIGDACAQWRHAPSDQVSLTTIRRGFHTLKGSSRMVGLGGFGDAGWSMEQVLNLWLAEARHGSSEVYALIERARERMRGWVDRLRADPTSPTRGEDLIAAADALRAGESYQMPAASNPQPAIPAFTAEPPALELTAPAMPEPMPTQPAPVESAGSASPERPLVDEPALVVDIGLPPMDADDSAIRVELPSEIMPEPVAEAMPSAVSDKRGSDEPAPMLVDEADDLSEFSENMDAVIAEFLAETGQTGSPRSDEAPPPAPAPVEAPPPAPVPVEAPPPAPVEMSALAVATDDEEAVERVAPTRETDTIQIGDAEVSLALYMIFLGEADELMATLVRDCEDWRACPDREVSESAIRAAHSLAGSSAIVGLHGVHQIAERLEAAYRAQKALGRPLAEPEYAELSQVVERMQAMLHQFAAGRLPREEPDALDMITSLRDRLIEQARAMREPGSTTLDHEIAEMIELDDSMIADDDPVRAVRELEAFAAGVDPEAEAEMRATPVEQPKADEFDADLLPVFLEEATDLMPAIGEDLRRWSAQLGDVALARQVMRALHTVKGGARMAGAMSFGQHVHEMETRVEAATMLASAPPGLVEELIAEHDRAMQMFDLIRLPEAAAPTAVEPDATQFGSEALGTNRQAVSRREVDGLASESPAATVPAAAVSASASVPLVRVRADILDRLVNQSGEVSIARARLDSELVGLRQSLGDLTENVNRLRTQLRELEIQAESQIQARIAQQREHDQAFDPLELDRFTRFQELTRMMAESVNDVATVQQNSMRGLDDATQDLLRQGQSLRELQRDLMRVRMVQFGSISDRFYRVVRQAGKETGKRVNLDLRGTGVEVDRGVLERMSGPIEHLLRNAVGHGIESRAHREAAGKPESGEIRVEVRQEGNEIVLILSDDGGGLDYGRILERARSLGMVPEGGRADDRELAEFIFAPGFSTAGEVTTLSGRGVGMDVVRSETAALGGRIEIDSVAGQGTRFTIRLPLTLAVAQVVMISAGGRRFAVPSSSVEQVLQLRPATLTSAYESGQIAWQGASLPLFYLGSLVEIAGASPVAQSYSPVVVMRSGSERIALHVDSVTRNQEVVVKNVGPQVSRVRGVSGATVLGDGDIVLIINPVVLAQAAVGGALDRAEQARDMLRPARIDVPATVMVVDDSVTVRKVTQRLLSREGYQVMLAKDGVDALRQMQDTVPDLMLVDIEMPRMDGFDLTRNVRADERYRHVPIIMITSRSADKHRNHALSLGVDDYMGKPYDEDELLARVASTLERRQGAAVAH